LVYLGQFLRKVELLLVGHELAFSPQFFYVEQFFVLVY